MGFGYGRRATPVDTATDLRTGRRVGSRFTNAMCAHVWHAMRQTAGQSGTGSLYFEGRTLFSYGSHFALGHILPDPTTGEGRSLTVLNDADSSPTTSQHKGDARRAVSGPVARVPDLTGVLRVFSRATYDAKAGGQWNAAAYRDSLTVGLQSILTDQGRHAESSASFAPNFTRLFEAAGHAVTDAARLAADVIRAGDLLRDADRVQHEADRQESLILQGERIAASGQTPESVALSIRRDAYEKRRNLAGAEYAAKAARKSALDAFRSAKAAKAAGRLDLSATLSALHKATLRAVPEYDRRTRLFGNLERWRRAVRDLRRGQASDATAHQIRTAQGAASDLSLFAGGVFLGQSFRTSENTRRGIFARQIKAAGVDPEALAGRMEKAFADLFAREKVTARAEYMAARREKVATVRAAIVAANRALPDDLSGLSYADLTALHGAMARDFVSISAAFRILDNFRATSYWKAKIQGVLMATGWTRDRLTAAADSLKLAEARVAICVEEVEKAYRAAVAANKAAAQATWNAAAAAAWIDGASRPACPPGLDSTAWQIDSDRSALLRARDVERKGDTITGGTLETSHGATVPLVHAVKAFRFLKLCRDMAAKDSTFDGWQANGKTVRVGHFQIDRVTPSGDFKAGCHWITWRQVAALADRLGLSDLTAADAREDREGVPA